MPWHLHMVAPVLLAESLPGGTLAGEKEAELPPGQE